MKHKLLGMLIALILGSFSLTVLASDGQNELAQNHRCNRPGVDCTFNKILEILEEEYGVTELPTVGPPLANYINASQVGNIVFVSSAGPEILTGSGGFINGELPTLTLAEAQEAAMLSCVRGLRFLKSVIGDLDDVKKVVKVIGTVNVAPDYDDIVSGPAVGAIGSTIDGCSNFLVDVFGEEKGKHARAVGGKVALPFNIATEIELIVEVRRGRGND